MMSKMKAERFLTERIDLLAQFNLFIIQLSFVLVIEQIGMYSTVK